MQNQFSEHGTEIVRAMQRALHALDEHPSQAERDQIYRVIAAYIRSAAPMAFVGGVPVELVPEKDALIDLGEGRLVRLRVLDGQLNLFVCESATHDAAVSLSETARQQLQAALGSVR